MDNGCRAGRRVPGRYRPRRPRESVLYRCVQEHLEIWLAQCRDGQNDDRLVPPHLERKFRRYLDCGILARQHLALVRARPLSQWLAACWQGGSGRAATASTGSAPASGMLSADLQRSLVPRPSRRRRPGNDGSLPPAPAVPCARGAATTVAAPLGRRFAAAAAQLVGVYQIGLVYARSVTSIAVPSGILMPKNFAS